MQSFRFILAALFFTLTSFPLALVYADEQKGVGYQERTFDSWPSGESLKASIWYPSATKGQGFKVNIFALHGTRDASLLGGKFPLVLISHGTGGSRLGHSRLAHELAMRGIIVAALDHPGDYWQDISHSGMHENWYRRPKQVSSLLDALFKDENFAQSIQTNAIGAIGHSIGGYTALALAGAKPDLILIINHCKEMKNSDPEFCDYGKLSPVEAQSMEEIAPSLFDERISVAVAIAPVGVIFGAKSMMDVSAKIAIYRFAQDTVLRYPYHAQNIINHLADKVTSYKVEANAHHFAAIDPFPEMIKASVGLPAYDPPEFDRDLFLRDLNKDIADFVVDSFLY